MAARRRSPGPLAPKRPMTKLLALAALVVPLTLGCSESEAALPTAPPPRPPSRVRLGIEELLDNYIELIEGRRVALVTNPSGVDGNLIATVDRLAVDGRFRLVRLFGPEHGIRGNVPAGDEVSDAVDPRTGIEVVSLYGANRRPSPQMLEDVDVILFDIQDVGARFYTYISTLGEVMYAAAATETRLIVLDRPNPLGGLQFDGPVIEEQWNSFIGWGPLPITHGLTIGEIALLYDKLLGIGSSVTVLPMRGWRRSMVWADTGLDWTPTSPHIPHDLSAHVYVSTALASSVTTNVSDGVGTPMPFEVLGAEYIDSREFARDLSARHLPGVRFQEISFRPFYGKYEGLNLHGVRLVIDDPAAFQPVRTALAFLVSLRNLYPEQLALADEVVFAKHWGNDLIRELFVDGQSEFELEASWSRELYRFEREREDVLIYDD